MVQTLFIDSLIKFLRQTLLSSWTFNRIQKSPFQHDKGLELAQNALTDTHFRKLTTLISQNIDLFATTVSDLVGTNLPKMHIDTENAKPVRTLNYRHIRQTPAAHKEMERQVKSVFDAGIIEESYSPCNSLTLLIRTRKCVLSNSEALQCNFFIFDHVHF